MLSESNDNYCIREFLPSDKDAVLAIWRQGRSFLSENGVNQWQKGDYPGEEEFLLDYREERGRAVVKDGEIVGAFAFTLTPELSYSSLSGSWDTEEGEYLTLHRTAVREDRRGEGIMGAILSFALVLARDNGKKSVRVDTHQDNASMRKALEKNGFLYKGELTLLEGSEKGDMRLGYEKMADIYNI